MEAEVAVAKDAATEAGGRGAGEGVSTGAKGEGAEVRKAARVVAEGARAGWKVGAAAAGEAKVAVAAAGAEMEGTRAAAAGVALAVAERVAPREASGGLEGKAGELAACTEAEVMAAPAAATKAEVQKVRTEAHEWSC